MREIKVLHLESTDVCQAACPLCARETDVEFKKELKHHLTMDQITQVFDQHRISNLDKMFMCGNYGDPAAGKHTLDIYKEFRKINPSIVLGMNTNGALQNTDWWIELASVLKQHRDYVVFSIDGLEDTNHIYRKNVDWKKLMSNAKAFINAGGSAHWDMLVYKHNQHQVEECKQLAKDMGFSWFRSKVSMRPVVKGLEFPINLTRPTVAVGTIQCQALQQQYAYINSQGRMAICAWLGVNQYGFINDIAQVQKTWTSDHPHEVCARTCITSNTGSRFTNQCYQEVKL